MIFPDAPGSMINSWSRMDDTWEAGNRQKKSGETLDLTPAFSSEERENHPTSSRNSMRQDLPDARPKNQKRAVALPSPRGRRLG
jgi:hypothetical protein